MLILMITTNDPAGAAINLVNAINNCTSHTARLITTETRYNFDYQSDLHLPNINDYSELEYLLNEADVIHFHMASNENSTLGPFYLKNYIKDKMLIHHHHGEPQFRAEPNSFRFKELKLQRKALVSTPDLKKLYPEAYWLPNCVPLKSPLYFPSHVNNEVPVISHSPTRRELKNTSEFISVTTLLKSAGLQLETKIIEMTKHKDCLRFKRNSDIFFDHMQGYYGISSLEALCQGVACIAGLSDHTIHMINQFTGVDHIPWVLARNSEELKMQITALIKDRSRLEEIKKNSRIWMEQYWNESKIAELYLNILSIND